MGKRVQHQSTKDKLRECTSGIIHSFTPLDALSLCCMHCLIAPNTAWSIPKLTVLCVSSHSVVVLYACHQLSPAAREKKVNSRRSAHTPTLAENEKQKILRVYFVRKTYMYTYTNQRPKGTTHLSRFTENSTSCATHDVAFLWPSYTQRYIYVYMRCNCT